MKILALALSFVSVVGLTTTTSADNRSSILFDSGIVHNFRDSSQNHIHIIGSPHFLCGSSDHYKKPGFLKIHTPYQGWFPQNYFQPARTPSKY